MTGPLDNFLGRLKGVKEVGDRQYMGCCPAHDDHTPSLSIKLGDNGGVLVLCRAGCKTEQVVAAVGLQMRDLFAGGSDHTEAPVAQKPKRSFATSKLLVTALVAGMKKEGYTWVKSSFYELPGGRNALTVMRFDSDEGKSFRPYHQGDDGRWLIGDPPGQLPLFHLPQILDAETEEVWVVEGEKCADAMAKLGLVATTSAHGSKSPRKTNWSPLARKRINVSPDKDDPGEAYAETVGGILLGLGCEVRIVRLPGLKEKGDDIEQWLAQRDCQETEDIVRELHELAAAAEPWKGDGRPEPEVYDGHRQDDDDDPFEAVIVELHLVQPEVTDWLWHNRIAIGTITLFAGLPEGGKGFVTRDLAVRISIGNAFPLESESQEPGDTLLVCCEDDVLRTVLPHLKESGANVERIKVLSMLKRGKSGEIKLMQLTDHLPILHREIKQLPNPRLVIIDPLSAYLGRVNINSHGEVYSVLAPLIPLAQDTGVAMILNHHANKSRRESAGERLMGSQAFTAICRNSWFVLRDPDDPRRGFGSDRLLLHGKSSLGPKQTGFRFTIAGEPAIVSWHHEPIEVSADDAYAKDASKDTKGDTAVGKAKEFITSVLSERGEVPDKDLKTEAGAAGHSVYSYGRAKRELDIEVVTYRNEDGKVKSCGIKLRAQHQEEQDDWTK